MNEQTKQLNLGNESEGIVLKAGEFYALQVMSDLLCRGVENIQTTATHFKATVDMIADQHDIAPYNTEEGDKS